LFFSCGTDQAVADSKGSDLDRLVTYMTGSFSSQKQAMDDSAYFDIRLEMVPIWKERSDAHWLYVEQAVASALDRPYRQRVYRVSQQDDATVLSAVYEMTDPLRFAGAWRLDVPLTGLTPDSLIEKDGCVIRLRAISDTLFVGSTNEGDCLSEYRGAHYTRSEVRITPGLLDSWDRGFDTTGTQVWGAEKGGYRFLRVPPEAAE